MRTNPARLCRPLLLLAAFLALGAACSKIPLMPASPGDQSVVHTKRGFQLIDEGKPADAIGEFDRAIALDPESSLAHAGRGTALGLTGKGEEALEALDKADDLAKTVEERLEVGVGLVRVHTALKGEDWLDDAEDAFEDHQDDAVEGKTARLHSFMGEAYLQGHKLKLAEETLEAGLKIQTDYPPARTTLKRVMEARAALAGMPEEYLAVATSPSVTRADVAAIFVAELKLDRLLEMRGFDMTKGFDMPEGRQATTVRSGVPLGVVDIGGHWAEPFMRKMLGFQVMDAIDNKFDPDHKITKAEFALLLDGIITKVTAEGATKGLGEQIFRDVQPDSYLASAAVTVTTRGFLQARPDGTFGVQEPVPGSTALESVRKIRDYFQSMFVW